MTKTQVGIVQEGSLLRNVLSDAKNVLIWVATSGTLAYFLQWLLDNLTGFHLSTEAVLALSGLINTSLFALKQYNSQK